MLTKETLQNTQIIYLNILIWWASLVALMIKNLPTMQETQVQYLEKEMTLTSLSNLPVLEELDNFYWPFF